MGPPQLQCGEIESKAWLQFFAVPCIGAQELLVVFAFLIPALEERAGKVESFPIPALRYHVDLPANLLLVNLFRVMRIRNIEYAALAVSEAIDEQCFVVGAKADVHWQHAAFDVTDRGNLLCLPFAAVVQVNQAKLRCQCGSSEGIIVLVAPGPADLKWRTWHLENFLRLTRMEIPHDHG